MEEVVSEIRVCRRCRLWRTAKNPVPGEGSLDTALMFIGEAPGYREDIGVDPFMGLLVNCLTSSSQYRSQKRRGLHRKYC